MERSDIRVLIFRGIYSFMQRTDLRARSSSRSVHSSTRLRHVGLVPREIQGTAGRANKVPPAALRLQGDRGDLREVRVPGDVRRTNGWPGGSRRARSVFCGAAARSRDTILCFDAAGQVSYLPRRSDRSSRTRTRRGSSSRKRSIRARCKHGR